MVAEYWRGEITLRKLRVLIEGLPQNSAVHRARTDGQTWTWVEVLLWHLIRLTQVQTASLGNRLGKPRIRVPSTHPQFPWASKDDDEDGPKHFGDRGGRSSEEVMQFLDSL